MNRRTLFQANLVMNTKARSVLAFTLVLLVGAAVWVTLIQAAPGNAPMTPGGLPTMVSYQGQVTMDDSPYDGAGYFKFAVVDAGGATTYWSNDGNSAGGGEPAYGVALQVDNGLFNVLLGDPSLENMEMPLEADVFEDSECYLRVWFSNDGETFVQLNPDHRIVAVPYVLQAQEAQYAANADMVDGEHASAFANASHSHPPANISPQGAGSTLDADMVDGLHASELGTHYQNVVVVAKSGGDYSSVQAAIDNITGETADNAYLVWVAPGIYEEQVTMKPYVHLQGAGQEVTVITSTASSVDWPPSQATLLLASDTSLRDLNLGNSGTGDRSVALLATAGIAHTRVEDVTARAQGGGIYNYAIYLTGAGTDVTLQQVTALGENGSTNNYGLYNYVDVTTRLHGGSFTGRGGTDAYGIYNGGSGATLGAEDITALAEDGSNSNRGLNNDRATAKLHSGSYTGRGGAYALGINNTGTGTMLEAESVTALAENGSDTNYGLANSNIAVARLRGGSFSGSGGTDVYGIYNHGSGTSLEAESVTVLAADGSNYNRGLYNHSDAAAWLRGGSFTGLGGTDVYGIYNDGSGTTLQAESVTALAENGSNDNQGLANSNVAVARLRGGSFTGRGGDAYGIYNTDSGTTLEADSVTALAEDGSYYSAGLYNYDGATARLRGGSFTGRGGTEVYGIYNIHSGTTLEAESITALAQDGSNDNYGLYNDFDATTNVTQSVLEGSVRRASGTVEVSNSRLVGGAVYGTVTCVLVTRGTTISTDGSTCP